LITASLVSTRFKPFQPFKHVASEHTRARQVRCSWKAQQQPRILTDIREAIGDTCRANGGISWKVYLFPAEQRQKSKNVIRVGQTTSDFKEHTMF
jgi:hypothetical protein